VLKPLLGYAERIPAMNQRVLEGLLQRGNATIECCAPTSGFRQTMVLGLDLKGANWTFPLNGLREARENQ